MWERADGMTGGPVKTGCLIPSKEETSCCVDKEGNKNLTAVEKETEAEL